MPRSLGQHQALKVLVLTEENLKVPIQPATGQLSAMRQMIISHDQGNGQMPPTLVLLESLDWLDLGGKRIGGPIPQKLSQMTKLEILYLEENGMRRTCHLNWVYFLPCKT